MKLWRESSALTICGIDRVFVAVHAGKERFVFLDRAQAGCAAISFFTEMEAVRASKSGMLRNSPMVRGFGCPHGCCDGCACGHWAPFRAERSAPR